MVKGVSRQVIVVRSPDEKLFEQAIFILKEDAPGVTDEELLRQAKAAARNASSRTLPKLCYFGPAWACAGAAVTGVIWFVSSFL
jgi:hypothetical protein